MDDDAAPGPEGFARDLARWSETLAAIARTGLGFTESLYERERFEAGETPVDEAEPAADPDARRRAVHEDARSVVEQMRRDPSA